MLSNQAHDTGVAEDALAEFEVLLTSLVGVLDPFARIIDEVLGLHTVNRQWVGWQKQKWRSAVKKADTILGEVFSGGSAAGQVLTVLTELRNLIHAEGLDVASFGEGRRNQRTWFTIPPETAARIREATGGVDIAAEWSFKVTAEGFWLAEPGQLVDRLVAGVMEALDVITKQLQTVLEKLVPAPTMPKPTYNVELIDQHVGWLLGFNRTSAE